MNKKQKELQNLLMGTSINNFPKSLRTEIDRVSKQIGLSGDVIADVIELWILDLGNDPASDVSKAKEQE